MIEFNETTTPGECQGEYILIREWIASDDTGNSSSQSQTITVVDNTAPVFADVEDSEFSCEEDFDFWVGNKVFVKLKKPINKTKKITGTLKGIFNKNIKLEDVDGDNALEIEVDNIKDINIIWSPEVTSLN